MNWIFERLTAYRGRNAGIEKGRPVTYEDFCQRIRRTRERLNTEGLPQHAVVSIDSTHQLDGLAALLALAEHKSVSVPLAPTDSAREKADKQKTTGVEWQLSVNEDSASLTRHEASARAHRSPLFEQLQRSDAPGLILFSSGSTGAPKAMLHNLAALLERYASVGPRADRSLQLLLIDHIGGLDAALRTLFSGSTLIIPDAATPDAAGRAIAANRVNILPASPTFLNLLLLANIPERYDCSSLEIIAYGAEPMSPSLLTRLGAAFPQTTLQQKFGTSETGAIRIKSSGRESLFFRITDRDTEWKIVDGELWLKTTSRILGYLNAAPDSLEADGWYRTGDLVEAGPDATLRILGRASRLINVGGQKAHPGEIESVLAELPEVLACQVYGLPDPITGSRVACRIASRSDRSLREWKRLIRSHCRGRLAPWKIPASLELVSEIDMTPRLKQRS